ncbi:MAG: patatin-like phospholipase family protein [Proteobacteria bacterium]|nr:patatin-like phospholipase family protein [Pseudomonadota bacterium]
MGLFRRKKPTSAPAAEPSAHEGPPLPPPPPPGPKSISLGLQGGGSHGAFEWGVLDRLLEEPELKIEAISAASAGAMNAVVTAAGLAEDGPRGAKAKLDQFWRAVNQAGGRNVFGDSAIWTAAFNPRWLQANPFYRYFEGMMASASPYEFNPFNLNPLGEVLAETVDFAAVRSAPVKLFISATDVIEGKARIFSSHELSAQVVLASSTLPLLFQAVEIHGRPYWDGGYVANPPLWPLFGLDTPGDVLIVMLNPMRRAELPKTAGEITDRLNEISFNAALAGELKSVAMIQQLAEEGLLTEAGVARFQRLMIHAIEADGHLDDLSLESKFDTEWGFLTDLKARGRKAAEQWLHHHLAEVGVRSSFDIRSRFS